jgi:hypothetical protein
MTSWEMLSSSLEKNKTRGSSCFLRFPSSLVDVLRISTSSFYKAPPRQSLVCFIRDLKTYQFKLLVAQTLQIEARFGKVCFRVDQAVFAEREVSDCLFYLVLQLRLFLTGFFETLLGARSLACSSCLFLTDDLILSTLLLGAMGFCMCLVLTALGRGYPEEFSPSVRNPSSLYLIVSTGSGYLSKSKGIHTDLRCIRYRRDALGLTDVLKV